MVSQYSGVWMHLCRWARKKGSGPRLELSVVVGTVVVVVVAVVVAASTSPLPGSSSEGTRLVSQYCGVWMHLCSWARKKGSAPRRLELSVVVVVVVVVVAVVVVVVGLSASRALSLSVSGVGMRLVSQNSGVWMHRAIWCLRIACSASDSGLLVVTSAAGLGVVVVVVVAASSPGRTEVA